MKPNNTTINISHNLKDRGDKLIARLKQVQKEAAMQIHTDLVNIAPNGYGDYIRSIHFTPTYENNGVISTTIYSDMYTEDGYQIARILENGTGIYALEPHIGHTKTFKQSGYTMWFIPVEKVNHPIGNKIRIGKNDYYIGKPQPARPHWIPAYERGRIDYIQKVEKVIEEEL